MGTRFKWPENLIRHTLGITDEGCLEDRVKYSDCRELEGRVVYMLATLPERTASLMLLKYKEYQTLAEISEATNLSRERVRQIIAKGLRMLRHPTRNPFILQGLSGCIHEHRRLAYNQGHQAGSRRSELHSSSTAPEILTIEDLNLSVRPYNCLKRANINSVADLVVLTYSELLTIRNMGSRSVDEIICALDCLGLTLSDTVKETELPEIELPDYSGYDIVDLNLPAIVVIKLTNNNITTIDQLEKLSVEDLLSIKQIGIKTVDDIAIALAKYSIFLKSTEPFIHYYEPGEYKIIKRKK